VCENLFFTRFTDLNKDTICESLLSPPADGYRSIFSYNLSKMCNMLLALELHRRWSSNKVYAFAIHPGNVIPTAISRNWWFWRILFALARPFSKSKVLLNFDQLRSILISYKQKTIEWRQFSKFNKNKPCTKILIYMWPIWSKWVTCWQLHRWENSKIWSKVIFCSF